MYKLAIQYTIVWKWFSAKIFCQAHSEQNILEWGYWHRPICDISGSKSGYWHRSVESLTEMSIDTNNGHVSLYGQVVWCMLNLTAYCYSGSAVCNGIDYGRGKRNGWKTV